MSNLFFEKIVKENVDIDLYPQLDPFPFYGELTLGDLHGNALKLLYFLVRHRILEINQADYKLFVDVPGLEMSGTYSFTISGNTEVSNLDYVLVDYSIYITSSSVVTSVKDVKVNDPQSGLFAYPNPYRNSTNIKADMDQKGEMLLEVYNMLGKKITTIDKCVKEQGEYSYKFSAQSLGFASGMYMIKLTTPSKSVSLKIAEE